MKNVICFLIIVGLLATGSTAIAQGMNLKHPRVEFQTQNDSGILRVYTFYDTQFQLLCYVTGEGKSIQCIPHYKIPSKGREVIDKQIKLYKSPGTNGKKIPKIMWW